MAESPAIIARKAKSLQQALKDILKNSDPWDKDVEFQRKDLRKKFLCLLLVHPYAKESKDAEAHLWMQTSYNFISVYKQRLATLDRAIQAAKQQQQQQQPRTAGGSGPVVEHRKLTQRFRQFLAEEEKFWTQLIVRHRREFDLVEVQPHLVALGILPTVEEIPTEDLGEASASTPGGRRPSLFPPDDGPHPPSSNAERNSRLVIVSKVLICLGDIARYRELYNDNRNKAGARRGRGGGPEPSQRPRNYEKAQLCYEKARTLTPDIGNASHQLAILSAYQKDIFTSLTHYYRALCVRYPFEAASENFSTVLRRAYEQWRRSKREREKRHKGSSNTLPKVRVDNFKENIVLLHALWRLDPQRMDAEVPNHAQHVADDFTSLVAERILPPDMISKVIVMSEGALWKHRMVRDPSGGKQRTPSTSASTITEHRIFLHILAVYRVLLDVGAVELAEPEQPDAGEGDLAQRITAVFRRTLPALRIAGKWLKANYKYVIQNTENDGGDGSGTEIQAFWSAYAQFFCALIRAFPMNRLPAISSLLEEDMDMKGFLPLRKTMGEVSSSPRTDPNKSSTTGDQSEEQVHPNVEQLMRIHDLLKDADAVVAMERCPVALFGSRFIMKGTESAQQPKPEAARVSLALTPHLQKMAQIRDERLPSVNVKRDDDAMTETTSRTEDDPVGDAFRTALDQDGDGDGVDGIDDDEEQIVWDPRRLSPTSAGFPSPPIQQSPMTPVKAPISPIGPPMTPTHRPTISTQLNSPPQTLRTAQDLLNSFNISPRGRSNSHQIAVSQPLLFGSGSLTNPGHSIWSPSMDDHVMNSASQNSVVYQSAPQQYHHAPSLSQSAWLSSQPMSSQHSQYNLPGALHPNGFVPPLPSMAPNHQRLPSSTVPVGHELYSTAPSTLGHAYTNTIANSLANSQHSSQQYPVNITYRPVEAALYETPHATGHPSIGGPNNLHTRHMSLVNDPRLGEMHGASRPLPQPWGHIS